jgi:diguanylate cyclase (GGDEF)-like protein/PAS domain S-box-containing protein
MHQLLRKQLAKAVDANGALDLDKLTATVSATYDDADKDRRRTDRSITLMVEELAQLNERLEAMVATRTAELEATRKTLSATLENVDQGIIMVGADQRVQVCNRRAARLLDLPADLAERRPLFVEMVDHQISTREFDESLTDFVEFSRLTPAAQYPPLYERRRPNGTVLEVRTVALDDGSCVRTYTDVTERREREAKLALAESEYRSLFENAVTGIYRSSLDGRQLRANPALVRLNGYNREAEMLAAVNDIGAEWYVDPERRGQFSAAMERAGRVDDFVSEIYRHRTRERLWVSETAWLVRSAAGEPLYYEGMVVDSSERVRAEARIAYLAHHDALTGLLTRVSFLDSLRAALRPDRHRRRGVAIHCIDLDRFKDVNDTLGHPSGDQLLRIAARRLQDEISNDGDIARLGGDEFAVIQRNVVDRTAAENLAARIVRILSAPYEIDGGSVYVGASIGVILAPERGGDPEELMKNADIALYRAKSDGRSTYRLFDPSMSAAMLQRRALEDDLRGAVARRELEVYLQPIVEIANGAICGFEALLRWRHPERGLMSPADFISIAEDTGLIVPIGEWTLFEACARTAARLGEFTVSVNLSSVQFRNRRIVKTVQSALNASGLPASRLVLEITESVLLMDDELTMSALNELRALGVRVALDDFGTGHSSLSYLQKFCFDTIKIDRSFVGSSGGDHVNAALVRTIISLGRELGISVIAEGIETEEQRARLEAQGCRLAQGYLFGRPRPANEWLKNYPGDASFSPARLSA